MRLVTSPAAAESIRHLPPSIKSGIKDALRLIAADPTCGEPLHDDLSAFFKYRVRRFRIIYAIDRGSRTIRVTAVGPRTTVYEQFAEERRRGA